MTKDKEELIYDEGSDFFYEYVANIMKKNKLTLEDMADYDFANGKNPYVRNTEEWDFWESGYENAMMTFVGY